MGFLSILFRWLAIVWPTGRNVARTPVLLVLITLAGGCASSGHHIDDLHRVVAAPTPVAAQEDLGELPEATTFGNLVGAPQDPQQQASTNGTVLHVQRDRAVYDAPGGKAFARLPDTELGSPTWVPVIEQRGPWAEVLLPSRPNSSAGWVRVDPTEVELARTPYEVDVNIDARRLVIRKDGRNAGAWTVSVGKPVSPTPRGRTFVMASIKETVTHFSPIILPLGTHSETYDTYGGGPGTVALHGWPDSSVFGHAASDGCVRVPPDALRRLTSLPLGTLVLLS
jgi:hypothetical protein